MKHPVIIIGTILLSLAGFNARAQKCDPYHKETGGFGYLINSNYNADLWWCEGAYKVMRDTKVPKNKKKNIKLMSAKNEYESFQLILNVKDSINNLKISVSELVGSSGVIPASNIEIRNLEYVNVSSPTDSYGFAGLWPDPLPLAGESNDISPGHNHTFWLTVYTPAQTIPGIYKSSIELSSDTWSISIPLQHTVWDFTLPRQSSIRSGFGLSVDKIADYHNTTSRDSLVKVFDLYMDAFRKYRIAPYSFYYLHQIKKITEGVFWKGGFFDSSVVHAGNYSLRIEDNSHSEDIECSYTELIAIDNSESYKLEWFVRSEDMDSQYTILVEAYDSLNQLLRYSNRTEAYTTDTNWKKKSVTLKGYGKDVAKLKLSLFPVFRTISGEKTGTVWFDDISLGKSPGGVNLIPRGDLEVNTDSINIQLDFTEFDYAAERYLDEFGFNSFRLNLEGMGSGTYYSREEGVFEGFKQGTPEYDKLMHQYLGQIEKHLRDKEWLGKEYVYWFDEPGKRDYPFVREGMELIKKSAPGITTFLTENDPGPEIMDVTDITCTIWHKIKPDKARKIRESGQGYWSYLCTAPKSPWVSEFIDHDAINMRMWLWMTYSYKLNGILIWSSNYWTSRAGSEPGFLQNPWKEAASYVQGYGWPLGKQTNWGNGDGRFWYPPNKHPNTDKKAYIEGPVPSIRLEFLRQGIEDYEYLVLLEELTNNKLSERPALEIKARKLLDIPSTVFVDGRSYTKDPKVLMNYRLKVAKMILEIQNKTK